MSIDTDAGMQMPGGSVADIQSDAITDNLEDADTLADMKNADPDMPDVRDDDLNADMNQDAAAESAPMNQDARDADTPIEDEDQLYNTSDVLDGGTNSSDLGAEQAGLADTGFKGTDAGLDISAEQGSDPTGDRATGLGAFRD